MRALRHIAKSESKSHNSPDSNFRWIFYTLVLCCYKAYPSHFSQVSPKLKRIQHTKNYQNGSSGFGEICLVLFLWRDRYSVPPLESRLLLIDFSASSARRWPPSTLPPYCRSRLLLIDFRCQFCKALAPKYAAPHTVTILALQYSAREWVCRLISDFSRDL